MKAVCSQDTRCGAVSLKHKLYRAAVASLMTSATLIVSSTISSPVWANDSSSGASASFENEPYRIDWRALDSLSYSRSKRTQSGEQNSQHHRESERQTELSFKLSPGKFDFSLAGAFGLGGVFANPALQINSYPTGKHQIQVSIPELHEGLSYSAGVKIDQEKKEIAETAYVSSSQLGVSYGRLGQVWYGGLDLRFGQSYDSPVPESSEVLSFDVTTGRRLELTGVGASDPMWLLSLKGNFDLGGTADNEGTSSDGSDWYLNPSLFWQNPGFTFSAQLELPVDSDLLKDLEEPDYRLRAIFEKRFR